MAYFSNESTFNKMIENLNFWCEEKIGKDDEKDIIKRLSDGYTVIELIEKCIGKKISGITKQPRFAIQKASNISLALNELQYNGFKVMVSSDNFVLKNRKPVASFLWNLFEQSELSKDKKKTKEELIRRCNEKTQSYGIITKNFQTFMRTKALFALVDALQRGNFPFENLRPEKMDDVQAAIDFAFDHWQVPKCTSARYIFLGKFGNLLEIYLFFLLKAISRNESAGVAVKDEKSKSKEGTSEVKDEDENAKKDEVKVVEVTEVTAGENNEVRNEDTEICKVQTAFSDPSSSVWEFRRAKSVIHSVSPVSGSQQQAAKEAVEADPAKKDHLNSRENHPKLNETEQKPNESTKTSHESPAKVPRALKARLSFAFYFENENGTESAIDDVVTASMVHSSGEERLLESAVRPDGGRELTTEVPANEFLNFKGDFEVFVNSQRFEQSNFQLSIEPKEGICRDSVEIENVEAAEAMAEKENETVQTAKVDETAEINEEEVEEKTEAKIKDAENEEEEASLEDKSTEDSETVNDNSEQALGSEDPAKTTINMQADLLTALKEAENEIDK